VSDEPHLVKDAKLPEGVRIRACERCGDKAIITRTLLSIYTGKTVRMFECSCGHRSWEED
jgi:hypothetical protein